MTIEIERDALLGALRQVADIVEARNTIPVLGNVLLSCAGGELTLTATNLDMVGTARVEAAGEIDTTVDKNKLLAAVASLKPGRLTLGMVEGRQAIQIKGGRGVRTLSTLPSNDFPKFKEIENGVSFEIAGPALSRLLDPAHIAMSTEETRYYLCGILLHRKDDRLVAAATDGHRLMRVETAAPESSDGLPDIIIPSKSVGMLRKLLSKFEGNVRVAVDSGAITADFGRVTLRSKLVDGSFPDYMRVVPSAEGNTFTSDRAALIETVDAVASVISAEGDKVRTRAVKLELGQDILTVTARDGTGTASVEEMPVSTAGGFAFGMNSRFLAQAAGVFAEDAALTLTIADERAPMRIVSDKDPDVLAVVMPMRV